MRRIAMALRNIFATELHVRLSGDDAFTCTTRFARISICVQRFYLTETPWTSPAIEQREPGGSGRSTRPRRSRALLFAQAFIIRQDCYGIGWLLSGWSSGIFPSFKKFGRFPHKILVLAKLKILTSVGFCWPSGYHIGAEPALEEPQKVHLKCFQELYQGLVTNKGVPSIPLEFPMRSKPL